MASEYLLQYLLAGVTIGSIYAIVAIGYNIIYNTTGVINFAQGEFVMLGAMSAISLNQVLPLPAAIICSVLVAVLVGGAIELVFIRPLHRPSVVRMVIITIGLSILIREIALHIWGEQVRSLPFFTGSSRSSIGILGAYISPQVLWVLGTCSVVVLALALFFSLTSTGQAMRACSANRIAASLCGINTRNMVTLSFMLSAGIGALAGCVVSPITMSRYDYGTNLAIKGFTVAIMGGLGNSVGAVAAGVLVGILETTSISLLPLAYKDAISIGILLIILFFRPSGLFGNTRTGALKEF